MADAVLNGQSPEDVHDPPPVLVVPRDTSFEHPLDETAPKPEPVHADEGYALPSLGGERRDIIPEHLRTLAGIRSTAWKYVDAAGFHVSFHSLRSPMYLVMSLVWAVKRLPINNFDFS